VKSRAVWFALALLGAGCLVQIVAGYAHWGPALSAWGTDDAYISYRYAANLVAGHGLVYNAGEAVEGYSNLLYVLVMAALLQLVPRELAYVAATVLNLACAGAALAVFARLARRRLGQLAGPAMLAFAACPPIWAWCASGMEAIPMLLLLLIVWDRLDGGASGGPLGLLLALALLVLTRADGFVYAGAVVAYLLATRDDRGAVRAGLVVLVVLGAHFAWRYGTYGDLLPNTYYVKVSGTWWVRARASVGAGLDLAWRSGLWPHLLAVIAAMGAALRARRPWTVLVERKLGFPVLLLGTTAAYWVFIGGDHFLERFWLVLVPMGAFAVVRAAEPLRSRRVAVALLASMTLVQLTPLLADSRFRYTTAKYDAWIELGSFLGTRHADALLAIDAAGKVPYFSRLRVIDMLGLNDRHIAQLPARGFAFGHNKYDADYVLGQRPDLIAAWIEPDLDLGWGLDRVRYEAAGYEIRYLVNTSPHSRDENILDVGGRSTAAEVTAWILDGYRYGVLERRGASRPVAASGPFR
jgi:hypothetical protein